MRQPQATNWRNKMQNSTIPFERLDSWQAFAGKLILKVPHLRCDNRCKSLGSNLPGPLGAENLI